MHDNASRLPSDPAAARAYLQRADELAARAARQARLMPLYMAGFSVAIGALTLLVGSADGFHDILAPITGVIVLAISSVTFAYSRPVRGGSSRRVHLAGWIGTGLLCAAALIAGILLGWPLWGWVIASVVVAIPLAVAAWTVFRSLR